MRKGVTHVRSVIIRYYTDGPQGPDTFPLFWPVLGILLVILFIAWVAMVIDDRGAR